VSPQLSNNTRHLNLFFIFETVHANRFISWKLKLGGIDKCLGDVNIHEDQIYIKKHKKTEKNTLSWGGGVVSQLRGGSLISLGVFKNITACQ